MEGDEASNARELHEPDLSWQGAAVTVGGDIGNDSISQSHVQPRLSVTAEPSDNGVHAISHLGLSPSPGLSGSRSASPATGDHLERGITPGGLSPTHALQADLAKQHEQGLGPSPIGLASNNAHYASPAGPSRSTSPMPPGTGPGPAGGLLFDKRPASSRPSSRNQMRGAPPYGHMHHGDPYARPPGDTRTQLFVGNLPFRVRWQDLKDLFRKCGSVLRSDVALTLDNRSKGFGTVLYAHEQDAYKAIETFNGYTWQSRVLDVRLDQQDPTGSIAMANVAAQQAQQHAYQSHQQAMQNMANMVGIAQVQNAAAAALYQAQGHPMFGQPHPGSAPWMAAALAANMHPSLAVAAAAANGFPGAGNGHFPGGPGGGGHHHMARAASPYNPNQLGSQVAQMSIRRHSSSTEGSSQPSLPHSSSTPSLPLARSTSQGQISPSNGQNDDNAPPADRDTQHPASGPGDSAATSPPPSRDSYRPGDSISPTSARRPPPGNLGPMPPSMFANISQSTQLPNPPAAAAAALAAGYSLEQEFDADTGKTGSPYSPTNSQERNQNSDRRLASNPNDAGDHPRSHASPEPRSDGVHAPMPVPGGLMNFYTQQRAGPGNSVQQFQSPGMSPFGGGSGRNTPTPAYSNRHLFVGNIPFICQWQDLKDLFRAAGQILRADVSLGPDGRSRGFGTVLFATPEDAVNAVQMFNGYEFQGRILKVHFDKFSVGGSGTPNFVGGPNNVAYNVPYGQPQFAPGFPQHGSARMDNMGPVQYVNQQGNRPTMPSFATSLGEHTRDGAPGTFAFDDASSIPGTPIHELSLHQMAAFPSPGFGSPVQHQTSGHTPEMRRKGVNSDGVSVAPIGSGAPGHHDFRQHGHPNHPVPLSPLNIPPMSMAMPSPGPGGLFSPPLQGMGPMMTPSMPGFSFHPFPQTPPLMPQFLSPGLGPFSPPLAGTPGAFFGHNGPSGLRNAAPGEYISIHSPDMPQHPGSYFSASGIGDVRGFSHGSLGGRQSRPSQLSEGDNIQHLGDEADGDGAKTPKQAETPELDVVPDIVPEPLDGHHDSSSAAPTPRRASFRNLNSNDTLSVPSQPGTRGGSLDIPRPNMQLGEISSDPRNGSALVDDADHSAKPQSQRTNSNGDQSSTTQTKKSPWNLTWLKK